MASRTLARILGWATVACLLVFSLGRTSDPFEPPSTVARAVEALAPSPGDDPFVAGQVLVRWREGCCPEAAGIDGVLSSSWDDHDVQHLEVSRGREAEVAEGLEARPDVLWAQLDYERSLFQAPDDPGFGDQWALERIDVQSAWDVTTGDPRVVVAVIDTGVDLDHPDLVGHLTDGYNFLAPDQPPQDDFGHGTLAAGTIAATMNNHIGVAGVAPNVSIMPLKALGDQGTGKDSDVADAIRWAADHGAWVINMSFGGRKESPILTEAVAYASDLGVPLVVAAGNSGRSAPSFPAATSPSIAVAATNLDDSRASYSNYGTWIHLGAPGQSIVSTYWDAEDGSSYRTASGTSMAAPHVAGVVALLLSARPDLTVDQIDNILQSTADRVGGTGIGAGRVNAGKALKVATSGSGVTAPATGGTTTPSPTAFVSPTPTATPLVSRSAVRTPIPTGPSPRAGLSGSPR